MSADDVWSQGESLDAHKKLCGSRREREKKVTDSHRGKKKRCTDAHSRG